jgi:CubicO group peptidase (beta-lactamase class C family)
LDALCGYPFVAQPGEAVIYSDIGVMLLGEAVSRLHGTPGELDRAIQARVLQPLELEETLFNPVVSGIQRDRIPPTEIDSLWRKRRVWGEVHDENACGVGGVSGHAGLFGSAENVARFAQAWLSGTVPGVDASLIREATREQAASAGERRGLGWMIRSLQGSSAGDRFSTNAYGHTGFVGNALWIDPEQELVVVCLTNNVFFGRGKPGLLEFRRQLHDLIWELLCA